jgi:hypothetical protein
MRLENNRELLHFVWLRNSTPNPDGSDKFYALAINPEHYDGDAGLYFHAAVASTWRYPDNNGNLTVMAIPDWRDYAPEIES